MLKEGAEVIRLEGRAKERCFYTACRELKLVGRTRTISGEVVGEVVKEREVQGIKVKHPAVLTAKHSGYSGLLEEAPVNRSGIQLMHLAKKAQGGKVALMSIL
ncbi:MAG: hypothetical protein HC840_01340 [Leptolyngbyaceae cyanobacterium RM2_2_4]|nr:hypothetical protein [Leptolyngbyaceae cyanobacterium RM2_2_4]